MGFNDVNALKERAYELGLISKQECGQLTDTDFSGDNEYINNEVFRQTLSSFLGNVVKRLDETGVDETDTEKIV